MSREGIMTSLLAKVENRKRRGEHNVESKKMEVKPAIKKIFL